MDHCAARASPHAATAASAASARATWACDAWGAPVIRQRTAVSRHDHRVAALQQDVLGQVLAALHLSVAEVNCLNPAIMPAQDDDIVAGSEGRRSTGEA